MKDILSAIVTLGIIVGMMLYMTGCGSESPDYEYRGLEFYFEGYPYEPGVEKLDAIVDLWADRYGDPPNYKVRFVDNVPCKMAVACTQGWPVNKITLEPVHGNMTAMFLPHELLHTLIWDRWHEDPEWKVINDMVLDARRIELNGELDWPYTYYLENGF